jgi:NAD-dependent SIR2 family protein deacetylase
MAAPGPAIGRAAAAIAAADALVIAAGAGMGVDSGLPDFRGDEGFWREYPALRDAGLVFTDIASPAAFRADPVRAWGFYGHRLALYRSTMPHVGFELLRRWAGAVPRGAFVFTSNVDGQFQRGGFDPAQVFECHGSIHHLQCAAPCTLELWPADDLVPDVDASRCVWRGPLPACPRCGGLARPNVLMFGDAEWIESRSLEQQRRLARWLQGAGRLVVVELGAGPAIPTVRHFGERLAMHRDASLVRINPRDSGTPRGIDGIQLALGARAALEAIDAALHAESTRFAAAVPRA